MTDFMQLKKASENLAPNIDLEGYKLEPPFKAPVTAVRGYVSKGSYTLVIFNDRRAECTRERPSELHRKLTEASQDWLHLVEVESIDATGTSSKIFINTFNVKAAYKSTKYDFPATKIDFVNGNRSVWVKGDAKSIQEELKVAREDFELQQLLYAK